MNINNSINKLLKALQIKNKLYKVNSFQFYDEKNNRYSIKYQILKRKSVKEYDKKTHKDVIKEKYETDYSCYSKVNIMKYLVDEYKKGSEAK